MCIPASTKGGGQCFAFPDVCKTPAPPAPFVPIPYPNFGMVPQAKDTSAKVKLVGKEGVILKSEIPQSQGDEAGTIGGMVSNVNMNKVTFKMGSSKVKFEGQKAIFLGSMTAHNGTNANMPAGAQIAPSQTKVLIMP
ncbi:MAG: DUF4150 domain-containing protein [Candidatus Eisenbacteria bacterium]|uniref:DUF4150 domain-containing protein n=1 Tax=Eiseniibacteriota bacterium TaxID=2212470 RepID=A0A948RXT5_UNCEI|nr:DUF4150 domain-containing protein [Candidatus Eisenbacteria bacterium]MBU1949283.1 DUF4150 domain-containing protein [Candidatus Eisenbacteria bacterium]MBU2692820.1 DUF4150 domain-containing protein [Candidatus Eisenbacteria bacterium]